MRTISVPYGRTRQILTVTGAEVVDVYDPVDQPVETADSGAVASALECPLGALRLEDFRAAQSVAIAINDKTRPVPHHLLLPPLLEQLERLGLGPRVRFYIATGTHTPMTPDEYPGILPAQILERYPVVSHDCDDHGNLAHLGITSRGVPVWVNRDFFASHLKIVVGNIEPHHFAGFSGGYKTAAIGMAGRETINANHIMLADPLSRMGLFEQNPLRQDIEEIGRMMQVQFALNVRLNARKEILAAYFGDPGLVLQAGIPDTRRLTETQVAQAYDLVITSPGGYPKDINFYQSQKALSSAAMVTRDGGTIILVAACVEGGGSASFEEFMEDVDTYEAVLEKFQRNGFRVGPHKALQVALVGQRVRLMIVSDMPETLSRRFLLTPAPDLQSAYADARSGLPDNARVAVLPHATNILPVVTT